MDLEGAWEKALKKTEIIRGRVQSLQTFTDTRVPYIFLAESSVNVADTIVRKGEVTVQKPSLILPPNIPQFKGFDFTDQLGVDENSLINFLLVRGISMPSFHYDNRTNALDIFEGGLSQAVKHYNQLLQQEENIQSGLVTGPEECWQLSLVIFICAQIVKNMDTDVRKLLDEYRKKNNKRF